MKFNGCQSGVKFHSGSQNQVPTARVLKYELGLPSYGYLKLKKLQKEDCLAIFSLVHGEWVFLYAAKNGTIFSSN